MPPVPTPQHIAEWQSQYGEIWTELLDLFVGRTVLWRMIQILGRKGRPPHYGVVLGAVQLAYPTYAAIAVRRLVDNRRGTLSVYKLLEQIANHPADLSRALFVSRWDPSQSDVAHRSFERLVGRRESHLTKKMVAADKQRLLDRTAKIVQWAHEHFAHRAAHPTASRPSFRNLRMAIEAVNRISNKYAELLGEHPAMMLVIPEPWETVFYEPLIRGRRRRRGRSIRRGGGR